MTALAVVLLWAAYLVRDVLLLIYMSGLLAIGFSPIVRLIERQRFLPIGTRRFPRWLAILVLYLFIIGVLVGIGFLVVPPLVHQAQQLWGALPEMFERAQEFLRPERPAQRALTMQEAVARAPVSKGGDAVNTVFGALAGVVGGLFGLLTILILTFYLLVEADQLRASLLRLFPPARRARVDAVSRDITLKVSAWLGGQLVLGAIIGATSALGLWLIGVPFFYVLALISGVGELIPVVGPILSAIPAIAGRLDRLAEDRAVRHHLLRRPAAVREPPARAEGHGAAGRRQRRDRHRRRCSSAASCSASSARSSRCRPQRSCRSSSAS